MGDISDSEMGDKAILREIENGLISKTVIGRPEIKYTENKWRHVLCPLTEA